MNAFDFDALRATRANFQKFMTAYPLEALNAIPNGFSNSMIWNIGHALTTQQRLHYDLSGIEPRVDRALIKRYAKGIAPTEKYTTQQEFEAINQFLVSTVYALESDFKAGKFTEFNSYTTSYGISLNNIEEAMRFNTVHEGLHLGYVMAMRKVL